MDWKQLKDFQCPKCKSGLEGGTALYECTNEECDFKIGVEKFDEIITSQSKPRYREPDRSGWE